MEINDIFNLSQYDEAFEFVSQNEGTTIEDLGGGQYKIVKIPEPTLDELKAKKRTEINKARDEAEQGGFEYMGKVFDSDPVSCQRISTAAQAMSLMPASEDNKITWTCQDNSTIDLNAQELLGLVGALAQWSNTCHQKASKLKEEVEKAKTKEELDKITWKQ